MTDVMASPCGTLAPAEPPLDPRIAWANFIRKIVTRPDAINEDGSLNQQFFKPKKVVYAAEKAKWNDDDKENLYKGIEKYGIDPSSWKKIIEEFCPGRDVLFIRIKASRLIGSQGLNRYHGWIGTCKFPRNQNELSLTTALLWGISLSLARLNTPRQ